MRIIFSQLLLTLYCFLGLAGRNISIDVIIAFLVATTFVAISCAYPHKKHSSLLLYAFSAAALFYPPLYTFMPMLFLEMDGKKTLPCIALLGAGAFFHYGQSDTLFFFSLAFGCILGLFLQHLLDRYDILDTMYRQTRDDSTERNLLLKKRNKTLLENQNYEIHNATLQERNRIAREIHDNVGHLLSRCILLNGAVQAVNQDENCADSLQVIQDTLSQAMDSIRSSVHNLHDNSINLQETIESLVRDFTFCSTNLEYDISDSVPSSVRYAFISITKEALTNIARHSNATLAEITLREHPAMYQLVIRDNGCSNPPITPLPVEEMTESTGIGLINIRDRVSMLNGNLQITQKSGFQIFISIPKPIE